MNNIYFPIQHLDRPPVHTPGLCDFYFAKVEDVIYWPDVNPSTGTYTSGILLRTGTTWHRCETIDDARDYKVASKLSVAGPYTEIVLEGFLPDDSPVNSLTIAAMVYHQFVIVLRERNKLMRLLGSADAGVVFSHSYESQDASGTRGSKLVFSWRSPIAPIIYLTAVSATGEIINPPWEGGGGGPEVDPTVPAWVKNITQSQIDAWNNAHGWGNHANAGYLKKVDADLLYAPKNHSHNAFDIDFVVGQPGAPAAGSDEYQDASLAGKKIRLFRSGNKKASVEKSITDGFTAPDASGKFTVVPSWVADEVVSIEILS